MDRNEFEAKLEDLQKNSCKEEDDNSSHCSTELDDLQDDGVCRGDSKDNSPANAFENLRKKELEVLSRYVLYVCTSILSELLCCYYLQVNRNYIKVVFCKIGQKYICTYSALCIIMYLWDESMIQPVPSLIFSLVQKMLFLFPETFEVTEKAIKGTLATAHEKMAAITCHGQQKCLLALIEKLEKCDFHN